MPSSLDAIRAKVEEVRSEHALTEIHDMSGKWCSSWRCNQDVPGPCDTLLWAESALKLAEEYAEFLVVGGWTKPWAERFDVILADIAEGLK